MTSSKGPFAWWSLAESAARSLTTPADVARKDVEIDRLVTGSSIYASGRSFVAKAETAWIDSRTARALQPVLRDLAPLSLTDRVRLVGVIATAGSLIALALQAVEPMRTGWLASILPAGAAAAGVIVVTLAEPISRAIADRRASRAQSSKP